MATRSFNLFTLNTDLWLLAGPGGCREKAKGLGGVAGMAAAEAGGLEERGAVGGRRWAGRFASATVVQPKPSSEPRPHLHLQRRAAKQPPMARRRPKRCARTPRGRPAHTRRSSRHTRGRTPADLQIWLQAAVMKLGHCVRWPQCAQARLWCMKGCTGTQCRRRSASRLPRQVEHAACWRRPPAANPGSTLASGPMPKATATVRMLDLLQRSAAVKPEKAAGASSRRRPVPV